MLVTVDFTPEEEQRLLQKMTVSQAPDLATIIKTAVENYNPEQGAHAAQIAQQTGETPSPAQQAQAQEARGEVAPAQVNTPPGNEQPQG